MEKKQDKDKSSDTSKEIIKKDSGEYAELREEHLSFSDIERLMSHDAYSKHSGVVRQIRWGK